MLKAVISLLILTINSIGFSKISEAEWTSLCTSATGQRKHTCEVLKKKSRITPENSSGNWTDVYKFLSTNQYLSLEHSLISDLTPLAGFTNLKELNLDRNKISDLSPLENLKNISKIFLDNNKISDISALTGLEKLEHVYLAGNKIANIEALIGLTNLKTLVLMNNQISNLAAITELTNMEYLNLADNQIFDLTPLTESTNLLCLAVEDNQISDFSPVDHVDIVLGKEEQNIPPVPVEYQLDFRPPLDSEINNEEVICPVCLNEYDEGAEISEIPVCRHFFHKECLGLWLNKHDNCPFCRVSLAHKEK